MIAFVSALIGDLENPPTKSNPSEENHLRKCTQHSGLYFEFNDLINSGLTCLKMSRIEGIITTS